MVEAPGIEVCRSHFRNVAKSFASLTRPRFFGRFRALAQSSRVLSDPRETATFLESSWRVESSAFCRGLPGCTRCPTKRAGGAGGQGVADKGRGRGPVSAAGCTSLVRRRSVVIRSSQQPWVAPARRFGLFSASLRFRSQRYPLGSNEASALLT